MSFTLAHSERSGQRTLVISDTECNYRANRGEVCGVCALNAVISALFDSVHCECKQCPYIMFLLVYKT